MNNVSVMILLAFSMLLGCKTGVVHNYTPNNYNPTFNKKLYPWRSANGKFGFCDSTGTVIITPEYDDAHPFHHGYAAVAKDKKYGVINAGNEVVVPLKYDYTKVIALNGHVLAITKNEYNAWWRFWEWKVDFDIIFGGPLLDTHVSRAKWQVFSLPGKEKLFVDRRPDDRIRPYSSFNAMAKTYEIPYDTQIHTTEELVIVKDNMFKQKASGEYVSLSVHFIQFTDARNILVRKGNDFYLLNRKGKRVSTTTYTKQGETIFSTTTGESISVQWEKRDGLGYVLQDQQGRIFLPSDLKTPIPQTIQTYKNSPYTIPAKKMIQSRINNLNEIWLKSIPSESDFILKVASGFKEEIEYNYFILHQDGSWNTQIPYVDGLSRILHDGWLIFHNGDKSGVLTEGYTFYPFPSGTDIVKLYPQHKYLYIIRNSETEKYGVYNIKEQQWKIPPKYDSLTPGIAPNVAIYTVYEPGSRKMGLFNMKIKEKITAAVYAQIFLDGRAYKNIDGEQIYFYINPQTGVEYREKN